MTCRVPLSRLSGPCSLRRCQLQRMPGQAVNRAGFWQRQDGGTAVEFALVLPVLMLFLLGIMEVANQLWLKTSLDQAVSQTARCAAIGYVDATAGINCASLGGAKSYLNGLTSSLNLTGTSLTVTAPSSGCLAYSYSSPWLTPNLIPVAAPTLTGSSCYYF